MVEAVGQESGMNSRTAIRKGGTGHRESCTWEDTAVSVVTSSLRRRESLMSELENDGFKVRTARNFRDASCGLEAAANLSDNACGPCEGTLAEAAGEDGPDPAFILKDRETH